MLGMAFFKSLIKEHGKQFFEPIGQAIQASGIKKPNPMNPAHAWALRWRMCAVRKWRVGQMLTPRGCRPSSTRCSRRAWRPTPSSRSTGSSAAGSKSAT